MIEPGGFPSCLGDNRRHAWHPDGHTAYREHVRRFTDALSPGFI